MNITVAEQVHRTITIAIKDRLDVVTAPQLKAEVERLLEEGVVEFVIDLVDTPFMDSAGMAVLVTLLRRCRMKGGNVKLVWSHAEPVQRTLTLTRFDHVFEILGR